MGTTICIAALLILDLIGYVLKSKWNKKFTQYHLRRVPYIWLFFD